MVQWAVASSQDASSVPCGPLLVLTALPSPPKEKLHHRGHSPGYGFGQVHRLTMTIVHKDDLVTQLSSITITKKEYKVYWTRFVVALLLAISSGMSSFILSTFIAIYDPAMSFFNTDNTGINMFSMVYMIFYLPSSLISVFWTERFGVGSAIAVGALMNCLCNWVRFAGAYHPDPNSRYAIVLFGQCIAAFGQPFLLNAPPRIANDWFPIGERDYWMHVMTQANNIGGAIGTVVPAYQVWIDPNSGAYSVHDIRMMLLWQSLAASGIVVLSSIFVRDTPPTPPTADVEIQQQLRPKLDTAEALAKVKKMLIDFASLLRHYNFMVLFTSFSLILGVSWAFMAVVGQMIYPCGYDGE